MTDEAKRLVEHLRKGEISQAMAFDASCLIVYLDAALEHTKRERDAAVDDLRKVCQVTEVCFCCKSHNTEYTEYVSNDCMDCIKHCNWQWRGPQEAPHD